MLTLEALFADVLAWRLHGENDGQAGRNRRAFSIGGRHWSWSKDWLAIRSYPGGCLDIVRFFEGTAYLTLIPRPPQVELSSKFL
jgi:hypothetical protein